MAKPIKETPILYGKDAREFEAKMKHPRKASEKEINRLKETYRRLKKLWKSEL